MAAGDWSTVVRMNKDFPKVRVVPQGGSAEGLRRSSFWDNTNKRWLSGVVVSTVTGASAITWAAHSGGATTAGETLAVRIAPPAFNAINDFEFINSGVDVNAEAALNPAYKNICAVNYGYPGPSAHVGQDGTITYTVVDMELASNAFSEIISDIDVTVAGNVTDTTGTNYDPYADNGGTITETMKIVTGPLASKYFLSDTFLGSVGIIGAPIAANYTALVVQIQSITTYYYPGPSGRYVNPVLRIANPQSQQGAQAWSIALPITNDAKKLNTISELDPMWTGYTWVFAVNAGAGKTIDANGVQMCSMDIGVTGDSAYNLANVWIEMPPGADCTVACDIAYKIKTNAAL